MPPARYAPAAGMATATCAATVRLAAGRPAPTCPDSPRHRPCLAACRAVDHRNQRIGSTLAPKPFHLGRGKCQNSARGSGRTRFQGSKLKRPFAAFGQAAKGPRTSRLVRKSHCSHASAAAHAPPTFRQHLAAIGGGCGAAPRVALAVTAIRLQSLTPSRLRRYALHSLPREQLRYGAALLIVDSMYGLRLCMNRRIHSSFNSGGTSSADGAKPSAFNARSLAFDIASALTRSLLRA